MIYTNKLLFCKNFFKYNSNIFLVILNSIKRQSNINIMLQQNQLQIKATLRCLYFRVKGKKVFILCLCLGKRYGAVKNSFVSFFKLQKNRIFIIYF